VIIINLKGGLGNQMFQYAFGRAISNRFGLELKLDGNYYFSENNKKSELQREYLLDKFNIAANLASIKEARRVNPIWKKILRKIKCKVFGPSNAFIYSEREYNEKDNRYYVGFWQNEKYFKDISGTIRNDFALKEKMSDVSASYLDKITGDSASVSIHVRRTDILDPKNLYGGICDMDYYKNAIALIKKKAAAPTFFVFSDDIEWCKKNLKFSDPVHFVSNSETKDYEELILMSKCKHNIIANSSFSWWGAWLNENHDKIVIAPKKWLNIPEKEYEDVLPENWTKI
jgi:hypothetical protein